MNYIKLDDINHTQLVDWYYRHEKKIKWLTTGNTRQTSVQYAQGDDVFLSSTDSLQPGRLAQEYNLLNPFFVNTPFEDILKKYNLSRTILVWLEPRSCYTIHMDLSAQLHIPLITNNDCRFIFPEELDLFHLPAGGVYNIKTNKPHSFCNFSTEARLHIIGCV
jgi:hypothetical protein